MKPPYPHYTELCNHGKSIKVWEKKAHYINLCTKCGRFWHMITLQDDYDFLLATIDNIRTYRHTIFNYAENYG